MAWSDWMPWVAAGSAGALALPLMSNLMDLPALMDNMLSVITDVHCPPMVLTFAHLAGHLDSLLPVTEVVYVVAGAISLEIGVLAFAIALKIINWVVDIIP